MAGDEAVQYRYQPVFCALLHKQVWAIVTRQSDGSWRIVNCLDKDTPCFSLECAFTTDHGEWPFEGVPPEQPLTEAR